MSRLTGAVLVFALAGCMTRPGPGPAPARPASGGDWAERTLASLNLRQKIGQLLMPRIGGEYVPVGTGAYDRLQQWVGEYGVGGVIITIGPPMEMAAKLNMMQTAARVPLLVSADMEHGPGQVLTGGVILPYGFENGGATKFPPLMALGAAGDEKLAYDLGRVTAIEGRAAGVHVAFAPVVDVNNNPANPIINTRSFGAQPSLVSRMASAHIRGLQDNGMLATAKHFPGHGDTGTDSHVALPFINVSRERADSVELPPYRAAIEAGVAGVMSAHIAFPAITGDSVPATLNGDMLTGLLRRDLGFRGLVFTDALDMGAIVSGWGSGSAAVEALNAGADVLLQMRPGDVPVVIEAVVAAVASGKITESRIDESVLRVLRAKQRLGLDRGALVDLNRIPSQLGTAEHMRLAANAAARSITVVRNRDNVLPLRARRILSIVYSDDYDPFAGRSFQRYLSAQLPELRTVSLDASSSEARMRNVAAMADSADVVLFSPFVRVTASRGGFALPDGIAAMVNGLMTRKPVVVTSFGNPYVLQQLPDAGVYVLAWAPWDPMQEAAARALLGLARVDGRLPIPLPPFHAAGEGIRIDAVSR
jgi:beta-N-acetylhexosaminidase